MTDFSKYPCGADGLSFPNGLPEPNTKVWFKTVWSKGNWQLVPFMKKYGWDRQYDWFYVWARPRVELGSMPIVLEWEKE